jgi:hypothetical protein
MLEDWVFMIAVLDICLVGLFWGCMLLFAPSRCPPNYRWGQPSVQLVRKPPLELGKRFLGLCLSLVIAWVFARPVVGWMLHPNTRGLIYTKSPSPSGMARWDELGFGLLTLAGACYLMWRPERSVELMFWADTGRLKDRTTLRLWKFEVRMLASGIILMSMRLFADFIRSLRN